MFEYVVAIREGLLPEDDLVGIPSKEMLEQAYGMMERGGST